MVTASDLHMYGPHQALKCSRDVHGPHKQHVVGVQGHAEGRVGRSIASTSLQRSLAAAGGTCVLLTAAVAPDASIEVLWITVAIVCTAFVISLTVSLPHHCTAKQC